MNRSSPVPAAAFTVTSQASHEQVGIATLLGDFAEVGNNHGRKCFKKNEKIEGHEDVEVFLYYWDGRDGPDFNGWWFGDQIGGSEVWATAPSQAMHPPRTGWKVPWNAQKAVPGVLLVDAFKPGGVATPRSAIAGHAPPPAQGMQEQQQRQFAAPPARGMQEQQQKQAAAMEEQQRQAEERDQSQFEKEFPSVQALVTTAEEAVEYTSTLGTALSEPQGDADGQKKALTEVEASANTAQNKLQAARNQINQKLNGVRKYAPEAKKNALAEYSGLQQKLTEAQKTLNPYKNFRQEFQKKVAAKKSLDDLSDKLAKAEVEVEKATMLIGDQDHLSEEEVDSAEQAISQAQQGILANMRVVDQKLSSTANGTMKEELLALKKRGKESNDALISLTAAVRKQREILSSQEALTTAREKVNAAEDSMSSCQDAEMPFLKGIEVLPVDESAKAIADSETAAAKTDLAINQARTFVMKHIVDTKRFASQEAAKQTGDELNELRERLEATAVKLVTFKKETLERKMAAMMSEAIECVSDTEQKIEELVQATSALQADDLESLSPEALKDAIDKGAAAEKEATSSWSEAKRVVTAKLKDAKGDVAQAISKLQARLSTAQQELTKQRKLASSCDKLLKDKEVLAEVVPKIDEAEQEIETVETLAKPIEGETPSDEDVQKLDAATSAAETALKTVRKSVDVHLGGACASVKVELQTVADRCRRAQEKLDAVKAATKQQRERAICEAHVKEAKERMEEVDAAMEKLDRAELPFLKGLECLPLQEATDTIKESENAAAEVQKAISHARTSIASKNLIIKKMEQVVSKPASEEMVKLSEQINTVMQKLTQFKKDTDIRRHTALVQDAGEKIAVLEEEVKRTTEAAEPFASEDADKLSDEEANDACEKVLSLEKDAKTKAEEARTILAERQRDARNLPGQADTIKELNIRLGKAQADLAKARKLVGGHEQKCIAKQLTKEADDLIKTMEEQAKLAIEAGAPLVERGGEEFLVATSVETITDALRDHMKDKDLSIEKLFEEVSGGKESISKEAFLAYLEKLPEAIAHDECAFTEERRAAILKHIDATKEQGLSDDGEVRLRDFKDMFSRQFVCVHAVSITDVFEVASSKPTAKLEVDEVLEAIGAPKEDAAKGMLRVECKVVSSGHTGWVTMQGNVGTKYLSPLSGYDLFVAELDKKVASALKAIADVSAFMSLKQKDLASHIEGPLSEAKAEILKLKPLAVKANADIEAFQKTISRAKNDYTKRQQAEKNAHIEARERKEAEALTAEASTKLDTMEASAKSLEDAASQLVSLSGADLEAFATPISVREEIAKLAASTTASVEEARSCVKEQQAKVAKAVKGPMAEAKRELGKMMTQVDTTAKTCSHTVAAVHKKCETIAVARHAVAAAALRGEVQNKGLTLDALFSELAKPGDDRIQEETFCERLGGLEGLAIPPEHAKLLAQHFETGGLGRRSFQRFLQQYFVVVKEIALTQDFEVSTSKNIRKAEVSEVIEVLEGPRTDEKLGLTRVKGKSLGDSMEGWITVKGNHGTPFLREEEKPYYTCSEAIPLEKEFKAGAEEPVRTLKSDEVIELIEGPRVETYENAIRVRGKACSDEKVGWFTVKDKTGAVFAEQSSKFYTCTMAVAITDDLNVKECNVVRKLNVDEGFTLIDGPVEDEASKVTRIKGKASSDGQEGWVTVKGNAGTVYATPSTKHYTITRDVPLQQRFASEGAELVRMLAQDEAIVLVEGPKQEKAQPETRLKGRALSDGAVGWITLHAQKVKRWSPLYKCVKVAEIHDSRVASEGKVLRELAVGETIEHLEGPVECGEEMRMRGRAEKDSVTGWVTIRDGAGSVFIKN